MYLKFEIFLNLTFIFEVNINFEHLLFRLINLDQPYWTEMSLTDGFMDSQLDHVESILLEHSEHAQNIIEILTE